MQPLIAHLIYNLRVGGLENGLVNLVNAMPAGRYRHAIVCLGDYDSFRERILSPEIPVFALKKRAGQDLPAYFRLWRLLRQLRPDILHSRTLGTLDGQIYGALAGVPVRIHGEHGRASAGFEATTLKHRLLRHGVRPLIHHYVAVSRDIAECLVSQSGISAGRVTLIYNGVDTGRFCPRSGPRPSPGPPGFANEDSVVIGTVGRMESVKDQPTLVRAFLQLLSMSPELRNRLRLLLVGDGSLLDQCRHMLHEAGAADLAWLPGERSDISNLLRTMDIFVLPSLSEGTSNTILEAMATGLPIVATKVGGNPELVQENSNGFLVPPGDPTSMAHSLQTYVHCREERERYGRMSRRRAESLFSMDAMVNGYTRVYDGALALRRPAGGSRPCPRPQGIPAKNETENS